MSLLQAKCIGSYGRTFTSALFQHQYAKMSCAVEHSLAVDQQSITERQAMPLVTSLLNTIRIPFHKSFASVGYVDIGPKDGPVCVVLHGAPGGIQDTLDLVEPLNNSGIRLLIPEFPGFFIIF